MFVRLERAVRVLAVLCKFLQEQLWYVLIIPSFISLASSNDPQSPWSARVSLRYNYKYDPFVLNGKFPGWAPNPAVQEFKFGQCKTPDELEGAIRRAQLALVHPLEDPVGFACDRIAPIDQDECHMVNFSPNIVCIHVTQPGLPNLSFYDLPGMRILWLSLT